MQMTNCTPGQGIPETIELEPGKAEDGVWHAKLIAREKGEYAVAAEYVAGGKTGTVSINFAAGESAASEAGEARDSLSRLALGTGGALVTAEDLGGVATELKSNSVATKSVMMTWSLRTWWVLAIIIPLILASEWLLQRLLIRPKIVKVWT
jgi:hypothetical protein